MRKRPQPQNLRWYTLSTEEHPCDFVGEGGSKSLELRRLVLVANTAELSDARLAGLSTEGAEFRSSGDTGAEDSESIRGPVEAIRT